MRLIPFQSMDEIHEKLEKRRPMTADERAAAIEFAEWHLGRQMDEVERAKFLPEDPSDTTLELTPVLRSEPPLIDVGQGRVIADMERDAVTMACAVAVCAAVPLGIGIAQCLVIAADAVGRLISPIFF